ncbi:hypothetical protein JCGZ_16731 [Jatropha curcas]|uniref:BHLH domain-containing protein n=2 Tax=Jatropha curcas TaxID=180498 RepID=A0A067LGX8_JATCU|nr:transcription factor bHLH130 isoform X2 [Jatropha curcas]XP_020532871.1 transcription factor bHLH130 isoform X2 [Jatropha curcas]KDP43444.1 hypothetical protein JCGZ_16731 [Jatropha curcas]
MSLLYSSPSFKYQDGELRRNQELMDLNHHHYRQEQQQHSSGLTRYRSAPSSFLDSLVSVNAGHGGAGVEGEDYRYFRSSSPEMDTMLARFMSTCNGSSNCNSHNLQEFGERPIMKQEMEDSSQMIYQSLPVNNLANNVNPVNVNNNSMDNSFGVMNSMAPENSSQASKRNNGNGSNLVRQSSSPAGFFSNLGVDSGFTVTKDVGSFQVSNGLNREASPSTSRLSNHVNFSSGHLLPQIPEIGDENPGASSPECNTGKRQYMNFANDSWDDCSSNDFKRLRNNEGNMFSGLSILENENGNSGNRLTGLTHHLSLPKTAAEMATIEKFLQFQGSVPCKVRAKRGCATHPRSIAERVRRTRISERMRKLQDLFPNMDKQTNTADMLDLAVEYIKDLQKQVKTLTDTRAKCTCPSKQKQYSNASA